MEPALRTLMTSFMDPDRTSFIDPEAARMGKENWENTVLTTVITWLVMSSGILGNTYKDLYPTPNTAHAQAQTVCLPQTQPTISHITPETAPGYP